MNALIHLASHADAGLDKDEIWKAIAHILNSPVFARAPRMRHLLNFLIEKKLSGKEYVLNEYGIGLDVFKRDARDYDTSLDPVVRVQMGRLRRRLAEYYAALPASPALRINIPAGSYVPVVSAPPSASQTARPGRLQLAPLRNLTPEPGASTFICGMEEEVSTRLFQAFGAALELPASHVEPANAADLQPRHRLEISVRVESQHVRASMRLFNPSRGEPALLMQVDRHGTLGMDMQEQMAQAICSEVQAYFSPPSGSLEQPLIPAVAAAGYCLPADHH